MILNKELEAKNKTTKQNKLSTGQQCSETTQKQNDVMQKLFLSEIENRF